MKMVEYQDYMRLLFDKYLKKLHYVLLVISLAIVVAIANEQKVDATEHSMRVGATVVLILGGYQLLRWIAIYLPVKLFGASESVKKDLEEIHQKHNVDQDDKSS